MEGGGGGGGGAWIVDIMSPSQFSLEAMSFGK